MKYAVIKTGGKQYRVSEGDVISVENLGLTKDQDILFPEVLLYTADDVPQVGKPFLSEIVVKGKVLGEVKGEKIRVSKFKSKVRFRRVTGHRQQLTQVQIAIIDAKGAKKAVSGEPKVAKSDSDEVKPTPKVQRAKKTS